MRDERLEVSVSFDERRGYVAGECMPRNRAAPASSCAGAVHHR
jgi:hypothetical protein